MENNVAIIPCLDEEQNIASVIQGVFQHVRAVVVVDDGSKDGTAAVAEKAGAYVLRHEQSLGKGAAIRKGLRHACDHGAKWVLLLDGDGQHAPSDIPAFFDAAERLKAKLIIGNRMTSPSSMPWVRWRVNQWMSRRLSRLTGQNLPDSQCGFRLLDLEVVKRISLQTTHFEIESEILLSFLALGEAVAFVPIQVIYKQEKSKISPCRDTVRWFRWWENARRFAAGTQKVKPARTP